MAKPKKNRKTTPASRGKHYYDKKKIIRKDGTVHAGAGKVRPHHKEAIKEARRSMKRDGADSTTAKARIKNAELKRLHRTPNRYQSEAVKIADDGIHETYQWMEDNGHADHVQMRRTQVLKDEDRMAKTFRGGNEKYKDNFNEIFGKRKRGVAAGYKKFKKTY